jgi:hypothetical protein
MIVDLDIPPTPPGTPNATAQPNGTQLLHYLYPNLYSANSTSTIGSTTFYELVNPQPNVFGPYASYRQPNPPNVYVLSFPRRCTLFPFPYSSPPLDPFPTFSYPPSLPEAEGNTRR